MIGAMSPRFGFMLQISNLPIRQKTGLGPQEKQEALHIAGHYHDRVGQTFAPDEMVMVYRSGDDYLVLSRKDKADVEELMQNFAQKNGYPTQASQWAPYQRNKLYEQALDVYLNIMGEEPVQIDARNKPFWLKARLGEGGTA